MGKRPAAKRVSEEEKQLAQQLFTKEVHVKKPSAKVAEPTTGLTAAWHDEDDSQVQVSLEEERRLRKLRKTEDDTVVDGVELQKRLKKQFASATGALSWADPQKLVQKHQSEDSFSDSDDDDNGEKQAQDQSDDIVRSTASMLKSSSDVLEAGTLEICRVKDANQHAPSNAVIQAVEFHPNGQMLLTAGLDKTLHLFQVDGSNNSKVESVFFKDLPITSAKFVCGGSRVVLTGPRSYFFSYDLEAGQITKIPSISGRRERKWEKFVASAQTGGDTMAFLGGDGYMGLLSSRSYQPIGHLKMNGSVQAATFCDDDRYLLSTGSDGQVYKWDLRTRKCLFVHRDEGSLGSGALAASPDGMFYAVGAESGVVNVYKNDETRVHETPRKSLMQLTTRIDHLQFNSDSQILAMASRDTKDALKMVHLPSFTVFSNWPAAKTPLHYVSAMAFSPKSGYFAVGNARGRVLLYRLTHYTST